MTVVLDSPNLERLWALLSELSAQLSANKEQCVALQRQAEELKAQAVHTNTGFALKRFNVDITQERFESELERSNAQLTVENQQLHYENRQLNALLKDYEGTLESVMGRFRGLAHSTQQHELALHRHYESLLLNYMQQQASPTSPYNSQFEHEREPSKEQNQPNGFYTSPSSSQIYDSPASAPSAQQLQQSNLERRGSTASVSGLPPEMERSLDRLSTLLRKTMRSLNDEEFEAEDDEPLSPITSPIQAPTSPQRAKTALSAYFYNRILCSATYSSTSKLYRLRLLFSSVRGFAFLSCVRSSVETCAARVAVLQVDFFLPSGRHLNIYSCP
ncbi:hypothetical protein BT69DRAFT_1345076 [Atractiella rhizophila]|nr:hypothetical protein BT69DRAFT_1345076 [Atractiella rhizophila]